VKSLKISKQGVDRYTLHFGGKAINGGWEKVGPEIQDILEDALIEANGDIVNFEFVGNLPERDLANVLYEVECVRKAREACASAHRRKAPRPELIELYDNFVTAAWTMSYIRLLKVIGFKPGDADDDQHMAS
jgi:hypothetical protein